MMERLDMQRILLYRPRHECLTTMYRAKYSCSSSEIGFGVEDDGAEEVVDDEEDSEGLDDSEAACRLTKSM